MRTDGVLGKHLEVLEVAGAGVAVLNTLHHSQSHSIYKVCHSMYNAAQLALLPHMFMSPLLIKPAQAMPGRRSRAECRRQAGLVLTLGLARGSRLALVLALERQLAHLLGHHLRLQV